jgi:hypothetical protein
MAKQEDIQLPDGFGLHEPDWAKAAFEGLDKSLIYSQGKKDGAEIVAGEIATWGNEECPHVHKVFATRPKRACAICWEDLKSRYVQPKEGGIE